MDDADDAATGQDDPAVPIHCADCGTETRIALADLAETLERHNDIHHDGESVAEVDPDVADRIADLVAADLDLLDGE